MNKSISLLTALIVFCCTQALQSLQANADTFFVTETGFQGGVAQFSSTGVGIGALSGGPLDSPAGIAFDSSGNIYVADGSFSAPAIYKYSATGTYLGIFATNGLSFPQGLAVDSSGNVYVANFSGGAILKFSSDGSHQSTLTTAVMPLGLALDSSGTLYVADAGANAIATVSASGTKGSFGTGATGTGPLNQPEGLAFDQGGNLYVSSYGNSTIVKFSADGKQRSVFASTGLDGPIGLGFDSAGNLYAVNNGNFNISGSHPLAGTVRKFAPDGTDQGTFITTSAAVHFIAVKSSVVSQPSLKSSLVAGGILLSWPASASSYVLESSESLNPSAWLAVGASASTSGGQFVLTNATTKASQYFRLRK